VKVRKTVSIVITQKANVKSQVFANRNKYIERIKLFQEYGYDTQSERHFILESAKPLAGSILEIGTGSGHMAIALAQAGFRFTTIDKDPESLQFAKLNIEYLGFQNQVTFEIENCEKMSFTDGSFDKILCVNALHHLERPFQMVDEVARVLATRGKIVLSEFTDAAMDIVNKIHADEGTSHQVSNVKIDQLSEQLVSKGFAIKKVSSAMQDVVIAFNLN